MGNSGLSCSYNCGALNLDSRAVLHFKSVVSQEDYDRLMDFVYIDSAEELKKFSEFVRSLGVKKIRYCSTKAFRV